MTTHFQQQQDFLQSFNTKMEEQEARVRGRLGTGDTGGGNSSKRRRKVRDHSILCSAVENDPSVKM